MGARMSAAPPSRWFELMEVVAVGLPFCGFKVLVGLSYLADGHGVVGGLLVALGAVDVVINAVNALGLLFAGRRTLAACAFSLLANLVPSSRSPAARLDLGNALDMMFSFSLVAVMIGGDRLRQLPASQLAMWNVCVIVNVLGAGLGRLGQSLRNT